MNITPKNTIYFEKMENGFINQLLGEKYWAVRDNGDNAYFDTLEEAKNYINAKEFTYTDAVKTLLNRK